MRLYIQRPYLTIHSNYPEVDTTFLKAYPSGKEICVEIWAKGNKELGIDRWMENGIQADLTLEQAKKLRDLLDKAIQDVEE